MSLMILAEATEKTEGLDAVQLFTIIFISMIFILTIPFFVVVFRKAFKMSDKQMQYLQRQCEHMDATERHMATVDRTLTQVLEELKRRPLS